MFAVYVDAEIDDPTDPDLVLESVLEGEYDDREAALLAAATVSRAERTLTLVYDLARKFQGRVGRSAPHRGFRQWKEHGMRTILVHLNVEVPDGDARTADEVADALLAALEVGSDDDRVRDLKVVCPMAEEI